MILKGFMLILNGIAGDVFSCFFMFFPVFPVWPVAKFYVVTYIYEYDYNLLKQSMPFLVGVELWQVCVFLPLLLLVT